MRHLGSWNAAAYSPGSAPGRCVWASVRTSTTTTMNAAIMTKKDEHVALALAAVHRGRLAGPAHARGVLLQAPDGRLDRLGWAGFLFAVIREAAVEFRHPLG